MSLFNIFCLVNIFANSKLISIINMNLYICIKQTICVDLACKIIFKINILH